VIRVLDKSVKPEFKMEVNNRSSRNHKSESSRFYTFQVFNPCSSLVSQRSVSVRVYHLQLYSLVAAKPQTTARGNFKRSILKGVSCGFLHHAGWPYLPMFRRNLLPPFSGLLSMVQVDAAASTEILSYTVQEPKRLSLQQYLLRKPEN
jgi:hypothetical protein